MGPRTPNRLNPVCFHRLLDGLASLLLLEILEYLSSSRLAIPPKPLKSSVLQPVRCSKARVASLAALAAWLVVSGCARRQTASHRARPTRDTHDASASAEPRGQRPKGPKELPSTNPEIYLTNLEGDIAELTRLVARDPANIGNVLQLSASHYTHGRIRGNVDEIQRGIDLASTCARLDPSSANCLLARAEQEQSLHRFDAARRDVERAVPLGADPARVRDLEAELDWNRGHYDAAIAHIRRSAEETPSATTLLRQAQLEADLGAEQDRIDALFDRAEDKISDTSPLPIAHLFLQRGIQRMQRGKIDEALPFLRAATERLPALIPAAEHLAEALHQTGKHDESIALYERIAAECDDPEFLHALADAYRTTNDAAKLAKATELDRKARARYEALLVTYPEAMAWHAAEFFSATGDTKRALDLLRKNAELRPNSGSLVALAGALLDSNRVAEAKPVIDKALAMPLRTASLFWTASRVYSATGAATAAADFRAQATRLNPRIVQDERATEKRDPKTSPSPTREGAAHPVVRPPGR